MIGSFGESEDPALRGPSGHFMAFRGAQQAQIVLGEGESAAGSALCGLQADGGLAVVLAEAKTDGEAEDAEDAGSGGSFQ